MKKLPATIALLLGGLLVLTLTAQGTPRVKDHPTVIVGTFDSRAVAVAYIRSDAHDAMIRDLMAERDQARERGDEERIAELEAMGTAMQKQAHEQGFGSAPVDDIMVRIEDRLPAIAEKAGVDVIVSKWVLAYSHPGAEFVDVTDLLAAEFAPDAETLKVIKELLKRDPVPLDQLDHDH